MHKPLSLEWTRLQVTHHTYTGITWFVVDLSDRAKLCSQSLETMGLCWYKAVEFDFKSVSRNTRQKTTGLCRHMSLIRYYLHMDFFFIYQRKAFVVSRKTNTMSRQSNLSVCPWKQQWSPLLCKGREPWEGFFREEATCPATFFPIYS